MKKSDDIVRVIIGKICSVNLIFSLNLRDTALREHTKEKFDILRELTEFSKNENYFQAQNSA